MGKIIPFQSKQQTLETLTNTLLSKIREGKFSRESSYSKDIIRHLNTATIYDVIAFLTSIAPLVEAIDWKKISLSSQPSKGIEITYDSIF